MLTEEEKKIYSRHLILDEIGEEGQLKLKNSKVLIIGAGGLGCPVSQYLVSSGVGTIGIVDGDKVEKSNLHRQILFGPSSVGENKAEEAKRKLSLINPLCEIITYPYHVIAENILGLLDTYDVIVDCTDNYPTRYLINDACVLSDKPYVYGAIHKFEAQVCVFNLNGGPTYRCLYPSYPSSASTMNCAEAGVLSVMPGVVGLLQANETLKLILGIGNLLSGKLMVFNTLTNQHNQFKIHRKEHACYEKIVDAATLAKHQEEFSCATSSIDDKIMMALNKDYEQIIDVREKSESPRLDDKVLCLPLNEINQDSIKEIKKVRTLVVCQSGIRSLKAIEILSKYLPSEFLENLDGGINSILNKKEENEELFCRRTNQ